MALNLLTDEFLSQYEDFPEHMNELAKFVYYRTYSRFLPEEGRRETWKETVRRSTEYNVGLEVQHLEKIRFPLDWDRLRKEAEEFFDSMFNLRQFLSGRTLWVGGAEGAVADKYPLSNFNCSFVAIETWEDLGDLFYLLLVGTGVGYSATKEMARNLKPVRRDIDVIHNEYTQRYPLVKQDDTQLFIVDEGEKAVIHVGDSKEGWVEALRVYLQLHTEEQYENVKTISVYYDYIRPRGYRLHTFGGTASGYEPLKELFEGITKTFNNEIDPSLEPLETTEDGKVKVRPVHILDIGNMIGNNVVVGGVRRTAEIFLFDEDDYETMFAKYGINGIWDEDQHDKIVDMLEEMGLQNLSDQLNDMQVHDPEVRPLHHRRMSNNSIAFYSKPSKKKLELITEMMKMEGEPGYINLEAASKRRPNAKGLNPCAEILLDTYGVCNLTTVNIMEFVTKETNAELTELTFEDGWEKYEYGSTEVSYEIDMKELLKAQRRSTRAGLRMTLVELELPHWDEVQQRDRLLGLSMTGYQDAMALVKKQGNIKVKGYHGHKFEIDEPMLLSMMKEVAEEEARDYADKLRVSEPLLTTTVKPEGTISQVAGGVSSGVHHAHAPYFIRRIRINANDPLAKAAQDLGWTINPEVGQTWENARTLVIDFPIKSGTNRTKLDVYIDEQFDDYFMFQDYYTEHNASNTLHVRPDEWTQAMERVYDGWDNFIGVSFLAEDGGTYELAPYETISEEEYVELSSQMQDFDPEVLKLYEDGQEADLEGADSCEGGACPIR